MNQRYAGIVNNGTNLTAAESAEIDLKIAAADNLLQQRRVRILREIDEENARLQAMVDGNVPRRAQLAGAQS